MNERTKRFSCCQKGLCDNVEAAERDFWKEGTTAAQRSIWFKSRLGPETRGSGDSQRFSVRPSHRGVIQTWSRDSCHMSCSFNRLTFYHKAGGTDHLDRWAGRVPALTFQVKLNSFWNFGDETPTTPSTKSIDIPENSSSEERPNN